MPRKTPPAGVCAFCQRTVSAAGMGRHLATCPDRQVAVEKAETSRRKPERLWQVVVRDAVDGTYWLQLELSGSATLVNLDAYLRAIWVECCGHMSQFVFGTTRYRELIDGFFALGDQKSLQTRVNEVLAVGLKGSYEYDYGTPTELKLEVVSQREGKPLTARPITLLARNQMPEQLCVSCGEAATHLCLQCYYEIGEPGCYLCAAHARSHACTLYGGPKRRYNSPRTGRCAYDGPARPPY